VSVTNFVQLLKNVVPNTKIAFNIVLPIITSFSAYSFTILLLISRSNAKIKNFYNNLLNIKTYVAI
jgi:hypothetical protein